MRYGQAYSNESSATLAHRVRLERNDKASRSGIGTLTMIALGQVAVFAYVYTNNSAFSAIKSIIMGTGN